MSFQISALPAEPFAHLFELSDAELAACRGRRIVVDTYPGVPCRVSLRDVTIGETVVLVHYEHLPVDSPFRASHAIYVSRAERARPAPNEVPAVLRGRLLSVRAFDAAGMLTGAEVCDGVALEPVIARMLTPTNADYLHVHFAKPGCYAARIDRA
ncbi:MAG TPA: DUF1203 domain-containing protein [Kofleriaceae bacterium]|jgi:hypothetical protein|nr:DUF1203 domain-containing protein [Kofleriaceae bacterium]